jgi:hypothetical protein
MVFALVEPLIYESSYLDTIIIVPKGFESDGASVPRIPIVYEMFGNRAHHEAVVHDYLYRIDSNPVAPRGVADLIFIEAMKARGKSCFVRSAMYAGVKAAGWTAYHKRKVEDKL